MARSLQKFLVAPYNSGLQEDKRAWLIGNDAFEELRNAYVYRGRVRKRFGSRLLGEQTGDPTLLSRLRVKILTAANNTGSISKQVPGTIRKVGQQFSVGSTVFTVYQTGSPADMLRSDNDGATATYNTSNGNVVIDNIPSGEPVYFYPAEPVMGIRIYEKPPINDEDVIAFDTQFAYTLINNGWERLDGAAVAGDDVWTGTDTDFFWSTNYRGDDAFSTRFFVVNNVPNDGIRVYDGTQWSTQKPQYSSNASETIQTARIVLPFKDRLILLNTVEQDDAGILHRYGNRCRFSANGGPFQTDSWRQDIPGKGNFIDAPTKEAIISAEFIQDRLIVYFERSTFELAYTQNQILPFVWRRLNSELGSDSTFSIVSVEQKALTIGNISIHACDGAQVVRIDDKIPDRVYRIRNTNGGPERVHGIRDFQNKQVYWAIPQDLDGTYPETVLIYDYSTGAWATADDSITALGYIFNTLDNDARTWESDDTWQERSDQWIEGFALESFMAVAAGNQQGYVFLIDPDIMKNALSLYVTQIADVAGDVEVTAIHHNLRAGDYIQFDGGVIADGAGGTNPLSFDQEIVRVNEIIDANTFRIIDLTPPSQSYLGGTVLRRVSQIDIKTKQYGFFLEKGYDSFVPKVDFYVDRTENGEITVDYFTDSSNISLRDASQNTDTLLGNMILETRPHALEPYEDSKERLWHSLYPSAEGEVIQWRFFWSDEQMVNPDIVFSDFQLHGMMFSASPATRTLQ